MTLPKNLRHGRGQVDAGLLPRTAARRVAIAAAIVVLAVWSWAEGPAPSAAGNRFTLEKLYALPRIIGTAPKAPAWSPDGRVIAVTEIDARKMPRRKIPDYLLPETGVQEVPRAFPGEETSSQRIGIVDLRPFRPLAGAPATNVFHAQPSQMWIMMDPRDNKEKYEASSPYYHAAGLRDPLLIIHGMRDWSFSTRIRLFWSSV